MLLKPTPEVEVQFHVLYNHHASRLQIPCAFNARAGHAQKL